MYKKIIKNKHGSAMLLMTLLSLASILMISLSLSAIVINGLKMGVIQVHSTKAFFAAEAGAERILWEIRKNGNDPGKALFGDFCAVTPAYFCFLNDTSGDLIECIADCSVAAHFENQKLSNNSVYNVKFKYDGLSANPTILTSYGSYNNEINRVVELRY